MFTFLEMNLARRMKMLAARPTFRKNEREMPVILRMGGSLRPGPRVVKTRGGSLLDPAGGQGGAAVQLVLAPAVPEMGVQAVLLEQLIELAGERGRFDPHVRGERLEVALRRAWDKHDHVLGLRLQCGLDIHGALAAREQPDVGLAALLDDHAQVLRREPGARRAEALVQVDEPGAASEPEPLEELFVLGVLERGGNVVREGRGEVQLAGGPGWLHAEGQAALHVDRRAPAAVELLEEVQRQDRLAGFRLALDEDPVVVADRVRRSLARSLARHLWLGHRCLAGWLGLVTHRRGEAPGWGPRSRCSPRVHRRSAWRGSNRRVR